MAPTRLTARSALGTNENLVGVATRTKQSLRARASAAPVGKRKACSPLKDGGTAKRAAFGDITNAINKSTAQEKDKVQPLKKVTVEAKLLPTVKNLKNSVTIPIQVNGKLSKTKQLQKVASSALETVQKHFSKENVKSTTNKVNGILKHTEKQDKSSLNEKHNSAKSARSDESEPSLYVSALDNISPIDVKEEYKSISEKLDKVVLEDNNKSLDDETDVPHQTPADVADFDRENWNDPFQVSHYAMDIFNYLKGREPLFKIEDYLPRYENTITSFMRAMLVDWMVEVQESFELNHETLYLGIKLVDLTLCRSTERTTKEELQLLGAASLFIASKFDERIPPLVDDFLYVCDGAYTLSQLLKMEITILKQIDYDLGIPLSYRFLRRYARCSRANMPLLTLARYVLELCQMDYELVCESDSKMAAAALYLALKMKSQGGWTPTLVYYTGYTLKEILPVALMQNTSLHKKPKEAISTIRKKYSHRIFFSVANVPLIDNSVLSS